MKTFKLLIIFFFSCIFSSCNNDDEVSENSIIGTWTGTTSEGYHCDGKNFPVESILLRYTFNAGGTGIYYTQNITTTGEIVWDDGEAFSWFIKGRTLTITYSTNRSKSCQIKELTNTTLKWYDQATENGDIYIYYFTKTELLL